MKKSLIILVAAVLALGATAQPKIGGGFRSGGFGGGGVHYVRPRVTVVAPYTYIRPSYGLGLGLGYGYSPFYSPYYPYRRYAERPSQLDLQIEDIKNDYSYQISSVKHDKSLPKDERKQKVRDLKHQREDAIIEAKKEHYKMKDTRS